MYEINGIVKKVGELQTFAKGFCKRELVVEEEKQGTWKNVLAFSLKKERATEIGGLVPGAKVAIKFAIDGREWTDPKTGKVRYFTDLTVLGLEIEGVESTAVEAAGQSTTDLDDDKIPF